MPSRKTRNPPVAQYEKDAWDSKAPGSHTHAQSDVANLTTDLAGKEPTISAGTSSQYWRGDKTWQTLPKRRWTMFVQATTFGPLDATTYYFGNSNRNPITNSQRHRMFVRESCTITAAEVYSYCITTAWSNENISLYIRKNGTTDTLVATVGTAANERVFSATGLSVSLVSGDFIEMKLVCPTWATNPAGMIFSGHLYLEEA